MATLYREQAHALVGLARVFVHQRDAAEDIVQESFIRLAGSLHRIEDPAQARAYLRSIVVNIARDHNRRGRLAWRHETWVECAEVAFDDSFAADDEHRRLVDHVRALPDRQCACITLRYLMELSVTECAATLGVSPNSVKTHLKRGLAHLRTTAVTADDAGRRGPTTTEVPDAVRDRIVRG